MWRRNKCAPSPCVPPVQIAQQVFFAAGNVYTYNADNVTVSNPFGTGASVQTPTPTQPRPCCSVAGTHFTTFVARKCFDAVSAGLFCLSFATKCSLRALEQPRVIQQGIRNSGRCPTTVWRLAAVDSQRIAAPPRLAGAGR